MLQEPLWKPKLGPVWLYLLRSSLDNPLQHGTGSTWRGKQVPIWFSLLVEFSFIFDISVSSAPLLPTAHIIIWGKLKEKTSQSIELLENLWDNCDPPTDLELISEWLASSALSVWEIQLKVLFLSWCFRVGKKKRNLKRDSFLVFHVKMHDVLSCCILEWRPILRYTAA